MSLISKFFILCIYASGSFLGADDASEFEFTGHHFVASYKECNKEALTNLPKLKEALTNAAIKSGAHILDTVDYTFEPDGLTMVILLSESHASIHTYPEHNACFVDLFTCGNNCSAKAFDKALQEYLQPETVNHSMIDRD